MGNNTTFFSDYLSDALHASAQTKVLVSVILAQWADETGYGGSSAFVSGNNYAGVSYSGVSKFPTKAAGLAAYIEVLNQSNFDNVRAAVGAQAQCVALGQGPNPSTGQGAWAQSGYDFNDYIKGVPFAHLNWGIDLKGIINAYNLTQYDGTIALAAGLTSNATTAGVSAAAVFAGSPEGSQILQPAPGFTSDIASGEIIINGTSLDLIVDQSLVTAQLDLDISKASTMTLTLHDPDRVLINAPELSEASLLNFGPFSFQLVSVDKSGSVLTCVFEAWAVAALSQATGAFTVAPGTMTRSQFAALLVGQVEGATFLGAPLNYLRSLKAGYTGQNQEQLSRGTSDAPLEDSWTCLQRLASEIGWVCFETFGTVYFGPYSWLVENTITFYPVEFVGGIDTIDGTYDVNQPLGELTVTCAADSWFPTIGSGVGITKLGPFDGTWIVSEMERDDLMEPDITITLMQPQPSLPEPATGGATAAVGAGVGNIQTVGGSDQAKGALAFAIAQLGKPYSETLDGGVGPNYFDCSGLAEVAYETEGINITRTTFTQWPSAAGEHVPPGINNLLPGDLAYFAPEVGQPPQHVAMVVSTNKAAGNVKVIEAPHSGAFVQYSTMNPAIGSSYGGRLVYIGALRPAP